MLLAERLTAGTATAVPVPVRLICRGLPTALSSIVMLPDCVPAAVGLKVILIAQEALAASVDGLIGQLLICLN
jgi:hypothetical protein